MKKALLFCALTVCALCGGYTPVLAEGEVETPSVVTEGDSILRSTVIVTRRDSLTEEEKRELSSCSSVLEQPNAIYHPTNGILPHMFSVGTQTRDAFGITKKYVCFSKGTLQYQPESVEGAACWRFAEHQYDVIDRNIPTARDASAVVFINLDKYSSGATLWYDGIFGPTTRYTYSDKNYSSPWGGIGVIYNGGAQKDRWRYLKKGEWEYLMTRTSNGNLLWFKGNIDVSVETATGTLTPVNGVFLLPDDFPMDFTLTDETAIAGWCGDLEGDVFANHTISLTDFERLEAQGVVFLPTTKGYWTRGQYYSGGLMLHTTSSFMEMKDEKDGVDVTPSFQYRLVQDVTY